MATVAPQLPENGQRPTVICVGCVHGGGVTYRQPNASGDGTRFSRQ